MSEENSNPSQASEGKIYRPELEQPVVNEEATIPPPNLLFNKQSLVPTYTNHIDLVFQTAQRTLPAVFSSHLMTAALISAMTSGERITLGQIVAQEAWDMAEALVTKYESKLSENATRV